MKKNKFYKASLAIAIMILIVLFGNKIYNDKLSNAKIYIYADSEHHYVIEENVDKKILNQLVDDEREIINVGNMQVDKIIYIIGSKKHECIFNIYVASTNKNVQEILYIEVLPASTPLPVFLEGRLFINLEAENRIYLSFEGNFYKGDYVKNIIAFDSKESFYEELITNDNATYNQLMGEMSFTDIIRIYE